MKNYLIAIFVSLYISISFAQNSILCSLQKDNIKIENTDNIPTVSDNGDGTITLTHQDQNITNIFDDHVIYDFVRSYPSIDTEPLSQYYTLFFQNKDLINELQASVPPEVFLFSSNYVNTSISSELINFLDNKTFRLRNYCSIADNIGEPCPEETVPDNLDILISFTYDNSNDLLILESQNETPCGNYFSIALKGGTTNDTLQLWESTPGISTETDYQTNTCHFIEEHLYSMLDISCINQNYGDLTPTIDTINNTLFLYRNNMVFGYHTATFEEFTLSVQENSLERMKPFQIMGNPYLQVSSSESQIINIEIYNVSGQKIVNTTRFKNNTINISNYSNGLYFIKLSNSNNQQKVFKFLKR
ncbi:putative secreted protein (Por secretion system target) [Ichthyenterobacterium magnum]|uniref:Putative secreted protein (Por secretion system target) n=2 Tax=Ichthyenterobacterium magnum TaxID=1230530 RepID=A0A420DFD8_9FLAO|nr:putative secreted protein (Por secretion system target) [Ichthyenterobacterium magnum]